MKIKSFNAAQLCSTLCHKQYEWLVMVYFVISYIVSVNNSEYFLIALTLDFYFCGKELF